MEEELNLSKNLQKQFLKLMLPESHWRVSKQIVKDLGADVAVLYESLCDSSNNSDEDGWFCKTQEEIKEETGLSFFKQNRFCKILIEKGLLKRERRGIPPRNWYILEYEYWEHI